MSRTLWAFLLTSSTRGLVRPRPGVKRARGVRQATSIAPAPAFHVSKPKDGSGVRFHEGRTVRLALNGVIVAVLLSNGNSFAGALEDCADALYGGGDYAAALRLCRPLAEQGVAAAQTNLGVMYELGEGVPQDFAEAEKWLRRAAEQGDADAQSALGLKYANGEGVLRDYAEAAKWFRKAAEQGDAEAQYSLGVVYSKGTGVRQDYAEAAEWYRKAADHGHAGAQSNLGVLYARGEGVPQDYVLAHMWFNLAAAQNYGLAVDNRDKVARKMTPGQIAEAQRLAREWQPTK
jgi:hypothetical protein